MCIKHDDGDARSRAALRGIPHGTASVLRATAAQLQHETNLSRLTVFAGADVQLHNSSAVPVPPPPPPLRHHFPPRSLAAPHRTFVPRTPIPLPPTTTTTDKNLIRLGLEQWRK